MGTAAAAAAAASAAGERRRRATEDCTRRDSTPAYTMTATAATTGQRRSTSTQLTGGGDHLLTSRRKVVRLLAALVVSFALCMLPHHVRVQWQEWRRTVDYTDFDMYMYIPPVTTLVFYVNSCLNPLLYALISDKFRHAFADLHVHCCRRAAAVPPVPPPAHNTPVLARRPIIRCDSHSC